MANKNILLFKAGQLEKSLSSDISKISEHIALCKEVIAVMRAAGNKKKRGHRVYIKKYSIEAVLSFVTMLTRKKQKRYEVDKISYEVKMHSRRYAMFLHNISCVRCGIIGEFFMLERMTDAPPRNAHFNMYGLDKITREKVLMTKDHIIPRSVGGADHPDNYQTMCSVCNQDKGASLEAESVCKQKSTDWVSRNKKWLVTVDKISGYPNENDYRKKVRYHGTAIDLNSNKKYSWRKLLDGSILVAEPLPKYILTKIRRLNLINF